LFQDVVALYEWWKPKVLELVDTACLLFLQQPKEDGMQTDGQDEALSEEEDETVEEVGSATPREECLKFTKKKFDEFARIEGKEQMRVPDLMPTIIFGDFIDGNHNGHGKVEAAPVEVKIASASPFAGLNIPEVRSSLSTPMPVSGFPPLPNIRQEIPVGNSKAQLPKSIPLPPPPPPPTKSTESVPQPVSTAAPFLSQQPEPIAFAETPAVSPPNPFIDVCIEFNDLSGPSPQTKSASIPLRGYYLSKKKIGDDAKKLSAWPGDREW
jgi:hypothetical protein